MLAWRLLLVAKSFDYNFKVKDLNGTVIDFKTFKGKTLFIKCLGNLVRTLPR